MSDTSAVFKHCRSCGEPIHDSSLIWISGEPFHIFCTTSHDAVKALTAERDQLQAEVARLREIDVRANRLYRALNGLDADSHDERAESFMVRVLDGLSVGPLNRNGVKAGLADQFEAVEQAAVERLREDAERMDWLDENIFHREMDDFDKRIRKDHNMWVLFAPSSVQGTARRIIDAARKEAKP